MINFNLLLENAKLKNYTKIGLESSLIKEALGHTLLLPKDNPIYPFIFSSFALSQDGKLCYPDTQSGLDIAKENHQATSSEKYGDLFWLMMARSISDAIIFSSNIFKKNSIRKKPSVSIEEFIQDRINNNKTATITPIIFCRNLSEINFNHEMLKNPNQAFLIFHNDKNSINNLDDLWNLQKLSEFNLESNLAKHLIFIDMTFSDVFYKLNALGYKTILNESPYFHHRLLEEKMLNEIWLNYSGVYIGGNTLTLGGYQTSFTSDKHPESEILSLYNIDYHFLYSRQLITYENII